jgi:signal transduction histidine kinase
MSHMGHWWAFGRLVFARTPRWVAAAAIGLAACALLMGPVVFFGAFALRSSLIELNARSAHDRQDTAALAATLVGRSLAARGEQLRQFAGRDDVIEALKQRDRPRLNSLLAGAIAGRSDITAAAAFDPAGVAIARIPDDPAVGQSFADRDYIQGALRSDSVYVGDAAVSRAQQKLVLVAVSLAVRESQRVVGILDLILQPSVAVDDLRPALAREGREILLIDKSGATLASTGQRQVLGSLGLSTSTGAGTASLDGRPLAYVAAAIPATTWTLYVLDEPTVLYTAQRTLSMDLGLPLMGAIAAAGLLAALLASAWLLLVRGRERLAVANGQLLGLNAEVQAATQAKSDFLASMSHELRTPLNAVLGFSDVLMEQLAGTLTDRQLRYLTNIRGAGTHLLELINDVLDLSRVEAGRLQLRPEPTSVASLVAPVAASAAQLATERGVSFESPEIPTGTLLVDPGRLRQVLLNLLSNAVKFTPAGGRVRLSIALEGNNARFEVADTGIGIPADRRDRLFGVFERLHEGVSDASGTGLGLAITKKLVELQHGTIGFESHEGRGTRFWVVLEDVIVEVAVGPRVLIVDDDLSDAELMAQLVRDSGLRVEIAPSASTALAAIARSAPIAVILDLRLPDERGDAVLRSLKAARNTAQIPVFVVSVEDDDGHVRLLGAADHMTKPIDRVRLRRWLASIAVGGGPLARLAS